MILLIKPSKAKKSIELSHCSTCGNGVIGLKNKLSLDEWNISGLCQECQDEIFKSDDEEQDV